MDHKFCCLFKTLTLGEQTQRVLWAFLHSDALIKQNCLPFILACPFNSNVISRWSILYKHRELYHKFLDLRKAELRGNEAF
jgi:hypothetical protein